MSRRVENRNASNLARNAVVPGRGGGLLRVGSDAAVASAVAGSVGTYGSTC